MQLAPLRQLFGVTVQAVQSPDPELAMQTLSVDGALSGVHAFPAAHAAFGQPVQVVVPPQQIRQYAWALVPMQIPHGLQKADISQRSPTLPVGSQVPLLQVYPIAQVDWPVPVHWFVHFVIGAQSAAGITQVKPVPQSAAVTQVEEHHR